MRISSTYTDLTQCNTICGVLKGERPPPVRTSVTLAVDYTGTADDRAVRYGGCWAVHRAIS